MAEGDERPGGHLREIEVRLWVEERELEALGEAASAGARADVEREIDRLRQIAETLRTGLSRAPEQPAEGQD